MTNQLPFLPTGATVSYETLQYILDLRKANEDILLVRVRLLIPEEDRQKLVNQYVSIFEKIIYNRISMGIDPKSNIYISIATIDDPLYVRNLLIEAQSKLYQTISELDFVLFDYIPEGQPGMAIYTTYSH
jgi:hypothetical protein